MSITIHPDSPQAEDTRLWELDTPEEAPLWRDALTAFAGPAAIGACLGWTSGAATLLTTSLTLPLSFALVGALTLPGLYIGAALADAAPPLHMMARTAIGALRDQGVAFLGLAPALLFMSATSTDVHESLALGTLVVTLGALIGMHAFYSRVRANQPQDSLRVGAVFALWALANLGLGWEIYLHTLHLGGPLT